MNFKDKVVVVTGGARGLNHASYDDFSNALAVGVTAPFYLTKLFMPYFADGACIINISSSTRPAAWEIRWISPIWCCSCARTGPDSSAARTFVSTAA